MRFCLKARYIPVVEKVLKVSSYKSETVIRLSSPSVDGISARERAASLVNQKSFLYAPRNRTNRLIDGVKSARRFGLQIYDNTLLYSLFIMVHFAMNKEYLNVKMLNTTLNHHQCSRIDLLQTIS